MRKLPPLAAIRVFEAAGRHENFTLAARELGMTQAAVSYQVKSLEDRLGAPLFLRDKGRARLTPLGRQLLPALSKAFDTMEQAFAASRAEDEALLTIATTYTFANTWLAWTLGRFQIGHPDLAVRLTTDNRLVDLLAGEADVAIRAGRGDWPDLDCRLLLHSDFSPMASPELLRHVEARLGRPLLPEDLTGLPLLSPHDDWWDLWFKACGVAFDSRSQRGGIRLDNQANEGHAAMAGQGFALLTPFLWRGDLDSGRLVQPFATTASAGYAYWLCLPPGRARVPKIKRFSEWLMAAVAA